MNKFAYSLLACLAFAALFAEAQVYKWTDKDGKIQYSDKPPPSDASKLPVKKVDTGASSYMSGPQAERPIADQDADFKKRRLEAREKEAKDERLKNEAQYNQQSKQQNCNNARGRLRTLQEATRVFRYGENGERVYVNEGQRKAEVASAEQEVTRACQ